jgi:serine/threonine protein kinase
MAGKALAGGRYLLEALIGQGGMGEVYRARDTTLHRKVALKVVRSDREGPESKGRLLREARAAAALSHPNTVAIHDLGESDGVLYIVMELVNGMPLLAYVGDDRVPAARKLRWCAEIARALACAHKAGVLHRDVKPTNVMVSDEGVAKVLDFGLAKPVEPKSFDFKTQAGHVVGTVRYMAPEQLAGDTDPRSDQYALGVTTYELLSGHYPSGNPLGVTEPLVSLVPDLPKRVSGLVERLMRPLPGDRFASMNDVSKELDELATELPVRVAPTSDPMTLVAGADTVREQPVTSAAFEADADTLDASALAEAARPDVASPLPPPPAAGSQHPTGRPIQAQTLLSREAPSEILARKETAKKDQKGTTANLGMRVAHTGPPTLASPAVIGARQENPLMMPPTLTTARLGGPQQAGTPAMPIATAPPPRSHGPLVVGVLACLAVAIALGTYLGVRARDRSATAAVPRQPSAIVSATVVVPATAPEPAEPPPTLTTARPVSAPLPTGRRTRATPTSTAKPVPVPPPSPPSSLENSR